MSKFFPSDEDYHELNTPMNDFTKTSEEQSHKLLEAEKKIFKQAIKAHQDEVNQMHINANKALLILDEHNRMRNDLETYLHYVIQWGLGKGSEPNPKHFGVEP